MSTIKVPAGYPNKQAIEIIAKWNGFNASIEEDASIALPTLESAKAYGLVAVSAAMARASKNNKWAKDVIGDGNAALLAEIEQFTSMADSILAGTHGADSKVIIGQIQNHLKTRVFLVGTIMTLADVMMYVALHPAILAFSEAEIKQFNEISRWAIHIHALLADPLEAIKIPEIKYTFRGQAVHVQAGQAQDGEHPQGKKKAKKEKKPQPAAAPVDDRDDLSFVDIRVAQIVKVWNHPQADSLYREEIDIGGGVIKQVVTGVRNFYTLEQMQNRRVLLFCNIKPAKVRGEVSEGMVFAASNEAHDKVEILEPPADAPIGTRITCGDYVKGEPLAVDKTGKYGKAVAEHFTVNADGQACYKGVPIMTPQGPITVPTLRNCIFK